MKRFYLEYTESGITYLWERTGASETLTLFAVQSPAGLWECKSDMRPYERPWLDGQYLLSQLQDWAFKLTELTEEEVFAELL